MPKKTRSRSAPLSPEVRWYLKSRGIPEPDCPPAIRTPEPRNVPGARFDPERVDRVLDVFRRLRHTQGEWAGRPLNPDPWQIAYVIAPVFGWVMPDGKGGWRRIIRRVHLEVPRKNGKTTLAGGIAIYLTTADNEPGAQVYAAASGKEQARFCFDPVKALAESAPDLKPHVKALRDRIVHRRTASYFAVVSRVADLMHGANVHGAITDELHVHKSAELVNAIETGMGSRRQPLSIIITTAGDESDETVYAQRHDRIDKLARGVLKDPTTYGVVWKADIEAGRRGRNDDPFDERTWKKANPGYGISPTRAYMQSAAADAQQSPPQLATFLRLHLNVRTTLVTKAIDMRTYDASDGTVDEAELEGKPCYGGLDLSLTRDLSAFVMLFPPLIDVEHGPYRVLARLWIPEENIETRGERDNVNYRAWVDAGLIRVTPGNIIDYATIEKQILEDAQRFGVLSTSFDPQFAGYLAENLTNAGLAMVPLRQGFRDMNGPWNEYLALLKAKRINHGRNAVLRWMADATQSEEDANGMRKPSKRKSTLRIDGIVAAVMALDRSLRAGSETGGWSAA